MIPKTIHYCWLGGAPLPELALKCIESWKKFCPDCRIVRWDESNLDLSSDRYVRYQYAVKNWALTTDFLRFKIVQNHGGVYFDVDVELIKPIDELLNNHAFIGVDSVGFVNPGSGVGSEKDFPLWKILIDQYNAHDFSADPSPPAFTVLRNFTESLGYSSTDQVRTIKDLTVYPVDYFSPIDLTTRKLRITKNTYSIHHFVGSWISEEARKDVQLRKRFCQVFGGKLGVNIHGYYSAIKSEGLKFFTSRFYKLVSHGGKTNN